MPTEEEEEEGEGEEDGVVDVEVSVNGQALVFVSTCCTVVMTTRSEEGARKV